MSRCLQEPMSIGYPVPVVLHRNEGLCRRILVLLATNVDKV